MSVSEQSSMCERNGASRMWVRLCACEKLPCLYMYVGKWLAHSLARDALVIRPRMVRVSCAWSAHKCQQAASMQRSLTLAFSFRLFAWCLVCAARNQHLQFNLAYTRGNNGEK